MPPAIAGEKRNAIASLYKKASAFPIGSYGTCFSSSAGARLFNANSTRIARKDAS